LIREYMKYFKNEFFLIQSAAFIITSFVLIYFSRTIFGVIFSVLMGLIAALFVSKIIGNSSFVFRVTSRIVFRRTYDLIAVLYAFLLISFFFIKMSSPTSVSLVFFQEWGAVSIQEFLMLLFALFFSFLLPGFFILRVIDPENSINGLDAIAFSFILSIVYTPIVVLSSLWLLGEISIVFYILTSIALLFACVIIYKILRRTSPPLEKQPKGFHVDYGLVLIIAAFITASFAFTSGYAYSLGSDVWRIQGTAISIVRYGLDAVIIPTNWYHVNLAFLFTASNFPLVNSTSILAFLNIFPIIAFYCMARKILGDRHPSGPAIASAFFALFSGFGWVYALNSLPFGSWVDGLIHTSAVTANDTIFSNLWNWGNNPFAVSFVAFFMLLYLLFSGIKKTKTLFALALLTFFSAWAVHLAEAYVFVIIFVVVLIFCQSIDKKSKLTIFAALVICLSLTIIITFIVQANAFSNVGILESFLLLIYLIGGWLVSIAKPRITFFKKIVSHIKQISGIALSVYLLVFFLWFLSFYFWFNQESRIWSLNAAITDIGFVPWYIYPIRLGVAGLFTVLALLFSTKLSNSISKHFSIIILLIAVLFIFGVSISFIKIFYFSINFWEIRILRYSFSAFVALTAAIFTIYLFDLTRKRIFKNSIKGRSLYKVGAVILVSITVVSGTMSTLFAVDYSFSSNRRQVSQDFNSAQLLLNETSPISDNASSIISISNSSADFVARFGLHSISNPMNSIISSSSQETYYFGKWFTNATYLLYMPEFDNSILKTLNKAFINANVIQTQNSEYQVDEASIYALPDGVPPLPNASTLFILPDNSDSKAVHNAFAQEKIGYEVASSNALTNLNFSAIILPYDTTDSLLITKVKEGTTLVVFNLNSFENFANELNLISKESIAPMETDANWTITTGSGQIKSSVSDNQKIKVFSGNTDSNGNARIDYSAPSLLNFSSITSINFKFSSNQTIQSVRFALFDGENNYVAYSLPYSNIGNWKDYTINLDHYTDASGSINLSSIKKIRIGVNYQANSTVAFNFTGFEAIFQTQNSSATDLTYNGETITLPSKITVSVLNDKDAIAFYTNNKTRVSPLIIEHKYGAGRILYVNSLPLMDENQSFSLVLRQILVWIQDSVYLPAFNWTVEDAKNQFEMYTKSVAIHGLIQLNSNSLIAVKGFNFSQEMLSYTDAQFSINATSIKIIPSSNGTYSSILVTAPFDLMVTHGNWTNRYAITQDCTFLSNTPYINANGTTTFENDFWRKNTRYWGVSTIFQGKVSFNIYFSDIYLLIFNFNYNGEFNYENSYQNIASLYSNLQQFGPAIYISAAFVVLISISLKIKGRQFTHE
jgi:hypothetical protein